MQDLPRISRAAKDGSLKDNAMLQDLIKKLKKSGGTCHLMGLVSPGGVHAHPHHIAALARIVSEKGSMCLAPLYRWSGHAPAFRGGINGRDG